MEHVCNLRSAWPIGHPLPPENPDRVRGPEVGALVVYRKPGSRWDGRMMRVRERSYVWSPGECRHNGGYRRYDWTVVEWYENDYLKSMVVNDTELEVL